MHNKTTGVGDMITNRLLLRMSKAGANIDANIHRYFYDEQIYAQFFMLMRNNKNMERLRCDMAQKHLESAAVSAFLLRGMSTSLGLDDYTQMIDLLKKSLDECDLALSAERFECLCRLHDKYVALIDEP